MKKFSYLVVLLIALFVFPFGVLAEETTDTTTEEPVEEVSKEVPIYFFFGDGCSYCAAAKKWFKEIESEYGSKFEIKAFETWYSQENAELMQKVAGARKETADGVPYIIIGDKSWNGFDSSYEEDMINQIKSVYAQDVKDRYDIMTLLTDSKTSKKDSNASDILVLLAIIVVAGGIGFVIYKARKAN